MDHFLASSPSVRAVDAWQSAPWAQPPAPPTVPREEFEGRLARVQSLVAQLGLDGLLISNPISILWLIDFELAGTFYFTRLLVPGSGDPALLTHRAEIDIARTSAWIEDVNAWKHGQNPVELLRGMVERRLRPSGRLRLGIESNVWQQITELQRVSEGLDAELVDVGPALEHLRSPASVDELCHLERAAAVADGALAAALGAVADGATEREVAVALARVYFRLGGQEPSLWPTVASGPRGAIRHALASDRQIQTGETVLLEVWANSRRYTAVSGATVSVGPPSVEMLTRWDALTHGMKSGLRALRPGVTGAAVYRAVVDGLGDFARLASDRAGGGLGMTFSMLTRSSVSFRAGNAGQVQEGSIVVLAPALLDRAGPSLHLAQTYLIRESGPQQLTRAPMALVGV